MESSKDAGPHGGLGLVALGALAWLVGGIYYGGSVLDGFMIGLVLIALGFAVAAFGVSASRGLTVAGFALGIVGIVLFLGDGLFTFTNLARIASHTFILALATMSIAAMMSARSHVLVLRVGLALRLVATVLWFVADLDGGGAWQPGNVLAAAGLAWTAWRPALPA